MNYKRVIIFIINTRAATICLFVMLFLHGCSLPKIIFLHDPLTAEEHNSLGRIYESQGKPDLASQQYRAAIKQDPRYAPSLLLLGDISYKLENYSEAESAYRKAIKLQPENGDIYNNLCWVYLSQEKNLEKAEELVRMAMARTPEHRPYYLDTQGMILLRQGRTAEAVAALREAADLLPRDAPAYLAEAHAHLAEAYRAAGNEAGAREAEQSAEKYRALK